MKNLLSSGWRFYALVGAISLCFAVLVGRLWWVQVYNADKYRHAAEENRSRVDTLPASRGKITDSRGDILAQNREIFSLVGDQSVVFPEDLEKLPEVAAAFGMSKEELEEKLLPQQGKKPSKYVVLKDNVDNETVQRVKKLFPKKVRDDSKGRMISRENFPIYTKSRFVREYPLGETAAHIIGYVNRENKAVSGIEFAMDRFLKGEDGWREIKRDGRRRELPRLRSRDVPARNGYTVKLTIDSKIQGFAEEACKKIAEEFTPISSSIIISEAQTGRILAMANSPSFNLNEFGKAPIENQRNRAVTDIYEPGSVFKIVSVAAALEEGVVSENNVFDCALSSVPYRGKMRSLPQEDHKMEKLSVREIIKQSSNRGTAQIAMKFCERYGEDAYFDYIKKFGFGEKTGLIGASGEQAGLLLNPKQWDGLTITRLPMGHSVSCTPLQTHCAMSVIAAGGVLMKPQVVRSVLDEKNQELLSFAPEQKRRVVSEKTAKLLASMLRDAVNPEFRNTGSKADVPGYEVAGKTGTTQKIINGKYSNDYYVVSFSGFFPASAPRIVITVVVDGPVYYAERWVAKRDANNKVLRNPDGSLQMEKKVLKTRAYAATVAAPIFKELAKKTIDWLEIPAPAGTPTAP